MPRAAAASIDEDIAVMVEKDASAKVGKFKAPVNVNDGEVEIEVGLLVWWPTIPAKVNVTRFKV
jgi:hypothetical protein